ncbi:(Fe-S)-binding protein [Shouchella lehensis]|uniref:Glycolate oxidase iron-sulfur subunit n=1 Tax=Shouchella lehensis G1 TaxID=1246626 RepID=A0A060M0V0_9BACI|nr:(Fe-S)-binding protein [Shouchella lehensis]AIC94178.1 glycolate oxidase iron-sulfur subunit [Shouchella lehensis G1]
MAKLAYEETFDCVQCGYCLPACPTYQTMEKETHSPRGRINLVKMAAEGKISTDELKEPIDLCLGCRACETACPTNVQYGRILESAKEVLAESHQPSLAQRLVEKTVFKGLLPSDKMLRVLEFGLQTYQKSGAQTLVQKSGILPKLLPQGMAEFEAMMPAIKRRKRKKQITPASTKDRVAYFTGCLMDTMFGSINEQAIALLERVGCDVHVIPSQSCCGALQHHAGDIETAKMLAKKNIDAFEEEQYDYIVSSIGGCGAMLMEYGELLRQESEWHERAEQFANKHVDVSIILEKNGLPFSGTLNKTAVYQPSCHMTHVQKNTSAPLALIQGIPGLTYVEIDKQEMCCGSAGIYNLLHYEEATAILDKKMPYVQKAKPDLLITTNPGCHLQMKLGIQRAGLAEKIEVKHLVEVLAEVTEGVRNDV